MSKELRDKIAKILGYCPYDIQQNEFFKTVRDRPSDMDDKIDETLEVLKELAKATLLTFSQDNEFVHIKGYGVYKKCDIEPENGFKIKIPKEVKSDE